MPVPITAKDAKAIEDRSLRLRGINPNTMDDAARAADPVLSSYRKDWAIQPETELQDLVTPAREVQVKKAVDLTNIQNELRTDISPVVEPTAVSTADSFNPGYYYTSATPLEQYTSYLPAGASTSDSVLSRQVSVPDGTFGGLYISPQPLAISNNVLLTEAGKEAIKVTKDWLLANDENYRNAPDELTRQHMLFSLLNANVTTLPVEDKTWFSIGNLDIGPNTTSSNIPDLSPGMSIYIKAYRAAATKRKANELIANGIPEAEARGRAMNWANDTLGKPQWWMDPETKRQRLAQAPEFQGMLGLGVTEYPSGATVESTPAYAMRMLMAPANMVAGMIGGGLAQGSDLVRNAREHSELVPVTVEADPALTVWDRSVRAGLDNVKRNRGATEEIYDLGIGLGVDGVWSKRALYGAALLTDVVFVPVVPGAGLATGLIEGGKAVKAAEAAGKLVTRGEKAGLRLVTALDHTGPLGSILRTSLERVAPSILEGFGDIRLASATRLAEASSALKAVEATPVPNMLRAVASTLGEQHVITAALRQSENVLEDLRALVPEALQTRLDKAYSVIEDYSKTGLKGLLEEGDNLRDLSRWTQVAIIAKPELKTAIINAKNVDEVIRTVLEIPEGKAAVRAAAVQEASIQYVLGKTKDFGAGSLYMLTPGTAVGNASLANKIMDEARKTKVAQALDALSYQDVAKVGSRDGIAGSSISSVIRLERGTASFDTIYEYIQAHRKMIGTADPVLDRMLQHAEKGYLTSKEARLIANMNIDEIARASRKIISLGEEEIGSLPAKVRKELMKPLELRDGLVKRQLVRLFDKLKSISDIELTPNVQRAVNDIQQQMATMPKTLSLKIDELMKNKEVARAYGLLDVAQTKGQALTRLVFVEPGKATNKTVAGITSIIQDLIIHPDTLSVISPLFKEQKIPSLIPGVIRSRIDRLTDRLKISLEKAIKLNDIDSALPLIKKYLEDVAIETKGLKVAILPTSSAEELLVTLYFNAEARRIAANKLQYILAGGADTIPAESRTALFGTASKTAALSEARKAALNHLIGRYAVGRIESISSNTTLDLITYLKDDVKYIMEEHPAHLGDDIYTNIVDTLEKGIVSNDSDILVALDSILTAGANLIENEKLLSFNADEAMQELHRLISNPEEISSAIYGRDFKAFLENLQADTYQLDKLKSYLALESQTGKGATAMKAFRSVMTKLSNLQYWFMLYARPRFHGANILTAPFIIASTLGGETASKALLNLPMGFALSARSIRNIATEADKAIDASIAIVDKAGRSYTWRDLTEIVREAGITRTEGGFESSSEIIKSNAQWLRDTSRLNTAMQLPGKFMDMFGAFAELSDTSFRSSVLVQALKDGESESSAILKARAALYDYGRISNAEQKYITNWFKFYRFTRGSVMNALENLITNPSRIANQIKASKGYNLNAGDNRSIFYEPEYMQARPWIGIEKGVDKEAYATYLPALPLVDSYILVAKVLGLVTGQVNDFSLAGYAQERTPAQYQAIVGTRIADTYKNGYIDPRHVAMLKRFGLWDTFSSMIGQPDIVPARPGETATLIDNNGTESKYQFHDQAMINRYTMLVRAASALGLTTTITDWAPILGEQPVSAGIDMQTSPEEFLGLTTQVRYKQPLEIYNEKTKQSISDQSQLKPK